MVVFATSLTCRGYGAERQGHAPAHSFITALLGTRSDPDHRSFGFLGYDAAAGTLYILSVHGLAPGPSVLVGHSEAPSARSTPIHTSRSRAP